MRVLNLRVKGGGEQQDRFRRRDSKWRFAQRRQFTSEKNKLQIAVT